MKNGTSDSNTKKYGTAIRSTIFCTKKVVLFSVTRCCSADTDLYIFFLTVCLHLAP
jgi:hypothetical protein